MKTGIHPKYYPNAQISCACGNVFTTGSTQKNLKVDICNACHPFFTGEMKFVDTQGRVEKFQAKMKLASDKYVSKKQRRHNKNKKDTSSKPLTLKDMLKAKTAANNSQKTKSANTDSQNKKATDPKK